MYSHMVARYFCHFKKLYQLYRRFSFHFIAFLFIYGFPEVIIYIYIHINNYSFIKNEQALEREGEFEGIRIPEISNAREAKRGFSRADFLPLFTRCGLGEPGSVPGTRCSQSVNRQQGCSGLYARAHLKKSRVKNNKKIRVQKRMVKKKERIGQI